MQLPQGFQFAGVACGIKDNPDTFDLALFVSDRDCAAAGVFTTNKVCGAPVQVDRERVPSEAIRAVVINSGNANACTGKQGIVDARSMTAAVGQSIGCEADQVLVCSTGIIGHFLPLEKIEAGIPKVVANLDGDVSHLETAARAMMTTDTFPKMASRQVETEQGPITIAGVAKGAAMIKPNMATMLSVIMTDAKMSGKQADQILRPAVNSSFNCISVEGHTSTSDTVLLLANGASGVSSNDAKLATISAVVKDVAEELAQMIIRDAEGADHFVTINVQGARSDGDAKSIANVVADDALVKTAITGNDPNWGRIVSACGRCDVELTEHNISLKINDHTIFTTGQPAEYDEDTVSSAMKTGEVTIDLELSFGGPGTARVWTCDLTQEYVRLNSEYTT